MLRTSTLLNNVQSGFALLPVTVALVVVASIVLLINFQGATSVNRVASDVEANQAHYIAQAGMQHALWQAKNSKCMGDVTIPTTALGYNNYNAMSTGGGTSTAYTLSVDQDAWIRSDDITKNNGGNADLHIRFETGKVEQPLVRFDLSTLPANAQINSASLWFYIESGKEHPEGPVSIHKIIADWTEGGVTWDSFNASFDNTAIGMISPQADSDVWVQVNVTAQVQAWVNGEPNYGVLLNSVAEGIHAEYVSSEGASAQHPRLEVIVGTSALTPLTLDVAGTLANGVMRTLNRNNVRELQPPNTVVLQPGPTEGIDSYIWEANQTTIYGTDDETWVATGNNNEALALFQFNMDALPVNSKVIDATLSVHHRNGNDPNVPVSAHRITKPWNESWVSWLGYDFFRWWSSAGGDYDTAAVATTNVGPGTNTRYEWDITTLAQGWSEGTLPNYGVILRTNASGIFGERFDTSDHADPTRHPRLTITYTCKCGTACLSPQGMGNVLMVIGNSPFFPSNYEQEVRDIIESWGYSVSFIQDDDSQGNFDAQAAIHDVVYVSETVSSANVGTKLTNLSIGVVNEQGNLNDELGMASGKANPIGTSVNIVDNSHYITYPFQSGSLEIFSKDMEGLTVSGTEAPGLQTLTDWSGTGSLVVLDKGMQTTSGGTAAGRRVMLPLGRSSNSKFNWDYLNNNGRLLVQRSLQWGAGNIFTPTINLLMVVVDPNKLTSQEVAKKTLLESWDYTVNLIDESDNQTAFDDAVAVNKVVFITEDVTASTVNTKLVNATIGVVTEEANLADEFGFSETIFWGSGTQIKTEGTHFIVEPFPAGNVNILSVSESLAGLTGARAPDLDIVAESPAGIGPAALEIGASVINGRTAAGRRVFLPWGGNNMDVNHLTDDGLTILQRALEWGASTSNDTTSPIAHWKLDEGTGKIAIDSVGGHDGTLINEPTWDVGQLGDALDFDGSNDYVDVSHNDSLSLTETMTFTAWVNASTFGKSYQTILAKDDGGLGSNYFFGTWQQELVFGFFSGGNFREVFTTGLSLQANTWYHLAATFDDDANEVRLYVDGFEVHNGTLNFSPTAVAANLTIGRTPDNEYWAGLLDDLRIYDRVLGMDEIAEITAEGGGGSTPPVVDVCNGTFRDEFNTFENYSGSDGTLKWSTDWLEINESDGPDSGDERVDDNDSNYHLQIRDNDGGGEGVQREADLSAYIKATFTFEYRRDGFDNNNDYVTIEVSSNGGSSWTQLERIGGSGTDSSYIKKGYDISANAATNTRIRFLTSPNLGSGDEFYIDNVQIEVKGCAN